MIRLYYLSKAAEGIGEEDIQEILATSRRNNIVSGVTGLLIVKEGWFAQALEGRREYVDPLYNKICWDARHTETEILSREDGVDSRIFPSWSMGYRNLDLEEPPRVLGDFDLRELLISADPYQLGVFFRAFPEDSLAEAL
ncbi:MAG: BLUF domain-containing protein [Planctomycetota bacterium]